MQEPLLTAGVGALDALIDGVRIGDNLVVVLVGDVAGDWLVDRFARAAGPDRLIVADAVGRHLRAPAGYRVLDWSRSPHARIGPAQARRELAEADEQVGVGAEFIIESLTALTLDWGEQHALDLFLWACPRLYRRRSVALWLVHRDAHDDAFVRQLTEVTQVVVELRRDGERVQLLVRKADGRAPSVVGRSISAQLVDGDLIDVQVATPERRPLGETLRQLRMRRGVGQADLARRVGISPSALSQAERGVRSVSAETLMRIWEILGVPFGPDDPLLPGYRIHRRGEGVTATLANGVSGRRLADEPATVWQLTISPRSAGREPLFAVKATETVAVLYGVLQLSLQAQHAILQEGDTLVADHCAVTGWANLADAPAEVLWIIGR